MAWVSSTFRRSFLCIYTTRCRLKGYFLKFNYADPTSVAVAGGAVDVGGGALLCVATAAAAATAPCICRDLAC